MPCLPRYLAWPSTRLELAGKVSFHSPMKVWHANELEVVVESLRVSHQRESLSVRSRGDLRPGVCHLEQGFTLRSILERAPKLQAKSSSYIEDS